MNKRMTMYEAYRKAGMKPEEVDFEALELDCDSVAKELLIKPKKTFVGKPQAVGPKDLLRAMGYSETGSRLPLQKWNPGGKDDNFPRWVKPNGMDAPLCPHPIPYVAATENAVTPYIGCEFFEDMDTVIRFWHPYVYIAAEKQWFRMTGGTPSDESGIISAKHFCLILRMSYEIGSLSCKHEWNRKYPLSAHDRLGQAYYRGLESHAPAYFIYYLAGRSYNDIEYFDGRKAEFAPAEMERKKKQEHRQKQIAIMQERTRNLERQSMLKELAEEFAKEGDEFKKKQRQTEMDRQNKDLEDMMKGGSSLDQLKKIEKIRSERED